jgi:hypothetical protein
VRQALLPAAVMAIKMRRRSPVTLLAIHLPVQILAVRPSGSKDDLTALTVFPLLNLSFLKERTAA